MTPDELPATAAPMHGGRNDPEREKVPIYRLQTARLAHVERAGYPGPQVIWFYCPSCSTPEDSRLVEVELEVVVPGEDKLDSAAFDRRVRTIVRVLARITRAQTEQILAAFARKDNGGMLFDICRALEDPTRITYDPRRSGERIKQEGGKDV